VKGVHSEIVHLHIYYCMEMHVLQRYTRYILAVVQDSSSFFIQLTKNICCMNMKMSGTFNMTMLCITLNFFQINNQYKFRLS